jgi:hypothetical protein
MSERQTLEGWCVYDEKGDPVVTGRGHNISGMYAMHKAIKWAKLVEKGYTVRRVKVQITEGEDG